MLANYELLSLTIFVVVTLYIAYHLNKFRSDKVGWGCFLFTLANIALQVSAFAVLPLDLMNVNFDDQRPKMILMRRERRW